MSETTGEAKKLSKKAIDGGLADAAKGEFVVALALTAIAEQLERLADAQCDLAIYERLRATKEGLL